MREYTIRDDRGVEHTLTVRWSESFCTHLYFLDGKRIFVDDRHGYTDYDGRPVNSSLVPQIDIILYDKVITLGVDTEEE